MVTTIGGNIGSGYGLISIFFGLRLWLDIHIFWAQVMAWYLCFFLNVPATAFNSLAPGGFENIFQNVFFKLISWIDTLSNSCETALRSMPQNPSDDKSTLVQVMAWCRQAASHYLSQCCPRSLLPYGVTRPQWVNSVWPHNIMWWHRSGSTLTKFMACCLMAPSHYLNQCWLVISKV